MSDVLGEGIDDDMREAVEAAEHVSTADGWLPVVRKVINEATFVVADGMVLDLFSASAMGQVYDALSPANQQRFAAMPLPVAQGFAFELINKARS